MNRTIIRRVRLTPDEDAALTNKLAGTEFSKWVRDEIGKFVATSVNVATKKGVATNVPTYIPVGQKGSKGVACEQGKIKFVLCSSCNEPSRDKYCVACQEKYALSPDGSSNVPTLKKDASVHAVKDELNKQLKDTPFTATIETIEKVDKLTLENLAGKGRKTAGSTIETYGENGHTIEYISGIDKDVPIGEKAKLPDDYVMAKNVRTKPINIKSTEKITIEGEKPVNLCAICKAPVKKGFLCKDCLSTK